MQNLTVLFPYLKAQHPYMLAQSVASPFSGAAIPPPTQKTKTKTRVKARAAPAPLRMVALQNGDLMGPNSARAFHPTSLGGIFGGAVATSFSQEDAYAEIQRLTHLLSQANPSAAWNNFGTQQALAGVYGQPSAVTVPSAFFSRSERPRPCYCFVHGFNIPHDSPNCRVMALDEQYTPAMRTATTPVGTGPNVGPPVRLPYRFLPLPTSICGDCLPPHTKSHPGKF